jgi:hypothetical protein
VAVRKPDLEIDLGESKSEALAYLRNNPDVTLNDFLRLYPARAREALPEEYLEQPLQMFQIVPLRLRDGEGVEVSPDGPAAGQLRRTLDTYYQDDVASRAEPDEYPKSLSPNEAVQIAYRHELQSVARFLTHDLSVLIVCDKILTEYIFEHVCHLAGKIPVLDDAAPSAAADSPRQAFDRATQGGGPAGEDDLGALIRGLKEGQVLVLRSVDMLDRPALIEALYQGAGSGQMPQLLGFIDPSLEAKKVLTDRFAVRFAIMGLPRYIQPDPDRPPVYTTTRLITAGERSCFDELDPEGLYKNVSGLNAIQFRCAMQYVGATVAPGSSLRAIAEVIRQFKTSSTDEIEIPDTDFDDIGGYEPLKQELRRIVALATGRVEGVDEQERQKLIPRGFIFHGPPGTGKTLFAKAIANEMNATIQMISGPEIMDKYVGQSESNLRHVFATARRNAPSVIFFDEFDSIAAQRSTYADGGARANNAVVAQLLTELDGFREEQSVLIIGTTNRLDIIDEALLRPSRLRPIQIDRPDYAARRAVAAIHAGKFGVDSLLGDLCRMVTDHLSGWQEDGEIPPAFLEALFAHHKPFATRYEAESQQAGFVRELDAFFKLVRDAQQAESDQSAPEVEQSTGLLKQQLQEIAAKYGIDLDEPEMATAEGDGTESQWIEPMVADLHELFRLVTAQEAAGGVTPEAFVNGVLDLVAEYTTGFNNDEIRAIFQESSLEHHLEGRLITPRNLGMRIGLIRKRRDERQVVHLTTD